MLRNKGKVFQKWNMKYEQTAALFDQLHRRSLLSRFQSFDNNIVHSHLTKLQPNELSFVSVH